MFIVKFLFNKRGLKGKERIVTGEAKFVPLELSITKPLILIT
jgi:hypothetical protein